MTILPSQEDLKKLYQEQGYAALVGVYFTEYSNHVI